MTPRDYQARAVTATLDAIDRGVRGPVMQLATGAGKTLILAEVAREMTQHGRVLAIAHREELIDQMASTFRRQLGCRVGIERAGQRCRGDEQIVVASVQTIGRDGARRLDQHFDAREFSCVLVDECVPAGTTIGHKPIEDIVVGDMVPSYDEESGAYCQRRVVRVMKRRYSGPLVALCAGGTFVLTTPNHALLGTSGWRPSLDMYRSWNDAATKVQEHLLVMREDLWGFITQRRDALLKMPTGPRAMHGVWEANNNFSSHDATLQEIRCGILHSRMRPRKETENSECHDGQNKPAVCKRKDDESQSDVRRGVSSKGVRNPRRYGAQTGGSWREWNGHDDNGSNLVRTPVRDRSGVEVESRGLHEGQERIWGAIQLQDRRGSSGIPAGSGDRREEPQHESEKGSGREKDNYPEWARVDGAEILQQGDPRINRLCDWDGFVYNIEVEGTHTYFANGILVHNCHHTVAANTTYVVPLQWAGYLDEQRRRTGRGPVAVGCSATLCRHDDQTIATIFDEVVCDVPMPWLIEQGYLVPFRAHRVQTACSLDNVRVRMGEFVAEDLERTLDVRERNSLAIQHYKEHGEGRQFLAFAVSVKHAHHLAAMWQHAGFAVKAIDGGTPSEERAKLIQDYKSGRLHGLVNMSVFAEGTDLPMTQAVYMLRPTKSPLVYSQQVGRGSRLWSAERQNSDSLSVRWDGTQLGLRKTKDECLLVDLCDITSKHSLVHAPSLIGVPYEHKVKEAKDTRPPAKMSTEPVPIAVHEAMLAINEVNPWEGGNRTLLEEFVWTATREGWALRLPDAECRIVECASEHVVMWRALSRATTVDDNRRHATQLAAFVSVDAAVLDKYGIRPKMHHQFPTPEAKARRGCSHNASTDGINRKAPYYREAMDRAMGLQQIACDYADVHERIYLNLTIFALALWHQQAVLLKARECHNAKARGCKAKAAHRS